MFRICYSSLDLKIHATNISKFLTLLHNEKIIENDNQLNKVLSNTATTAVTTDILTDNKVPKARSTFENIDQTSEAFKIMSTNDSKNYTEDQINKVIEANFFIYNEHKRPIDFWKQYLSQMLIYRYG